jgi:hypothetical protein
MPAQNPTRLRPRRLAAAREATTDLDVIFSFLRLFTQWSGGTM